MKLHLCRALVGLLVVATPALAAQDCSNGPIADSPVHGTVNGQPFVPQQATLDFTKDGMVIDDVHLDRYVLSIQTDGIFNEFTINMMVPSGKKPDGRTFRVLPIDSISKQPAVAPGTPEVQGWDLSQENADVDTSFTQQIASIRVEMGTRMGNVLPGRVHVCVPGVKTEIVGAFNATIR